MKQATKKFKSADGEAKPLDTSRMETSMWLVKLPDYVVEQWRHAGQDEIVGNFMIRNKADGKREMLVEIPDNVAGEDNMPKLIEMTETVHEGADMLVFSKDAKKDSHFCIDGKVTKRCSMKAVNSAEANKIIRLRSQSKQAEKQEIQLASIAEIEQSRSEATMIDFGPVAKVEAKRLSAYGNLSSSAGGEKKLEELEERFFVAFERERYMKKDQIMTACLTGNFTVQDVQNLIERYTKFNSSGQRKDHYELKPELK